MRFIRTTLIALFTVVLALYVYSDYRTRTLGLEDGPVLTVEDGVLEISVSDPEDVLLKGVYAYDELDGDITSEIMVSGVSKLLSDNTAKVTYLVFDSNDNIAQVTRRIRYTDYSRPEISLVTPLVFNSKDATGIISHFSATDVIDGDISSSVRISSLVPTADSKIYYVTVQVMNSMGDNAKLKLPVVIADDSDAPVITLSSYVDYIDAGSEFDAAAYISSVVCKGVPADVGNVKISGEIDTGVPGTYYIFYECDIENHVGKAALTVVVR